MLTDANMFISMLLGEGKLVFIRKEIDLGFESTLSLHCTVNNRTVKMSLDEGRAVLCFVTEGETIFPFPRLWAQEKMSKLCSTTLANYSIIKQFSNLPSF